MHKSIPNRKSIVPEPGEDSLRGVEPGDHVYLRVFRRHWNEPRREETCRVAGATSTAIQVEWNTIWSHPNHCTTTIQPRTREEAGKDRDADVSRPNQPPGRPDPAQQELQHQNKGAGADESAPEALRVPAGSTSPGEEKKKKKEECVFSSETCAVSFSQAIPHLKGHSQMQ